MIGWKDALEKASDSVLGLSVAAAFGGFGWLVRRILTNQKQIELMQAEIKARDALRDRDREDILEVKQVVKDLRVDLKSLLSRVH